MSCLRFALVFGFALSGCVALPAPPVAPVPADRRFLVGATAGLEVSPVEAVVTSPETGRVRLKGTWNGRREAAPIPNLFDPRLWLTYAASDEVQLSGHLSWLTNGVQIHYLPGGRQASRPLVFTLGAQTDSLLGRDAFGRPGFGWEIRGGLSWHPRLGASFPLALGLGASQGARRRTVVAPDETVGRNQVDNVVPAAMMILRPETRLEALVGIGVALGPLQLSVAAQPFWIVADGRSRGSCYLCAEGTRLESFTSSWGAALTATATLAGGRR